MKLTQSDVRDFKWNSLFMNRKKNEQRLKSIHDKILTEESKSILFKSNGVTVVARWRESMTIPCRFYVVCVKAYQLNHTVPYVK